MPVIDRVGIRIPVHSFVRALCARIGGPLAQTSANLSGVESPLRVDEFEDLFPHIDLINDGGPIEIGR
jgi:tRNA A37 threonylcarbamoyladenosine synthetase subunit TsaC/SUA5/YrdC